MFVSKIVVLILIYSCFSSTIQDTVKVSLYYEPLCPYCLDFINKQLYPGYKTLGDSLNVFLVPYGKAKAKNKRGHWKFTCQHGSKECHATRIQDCVLGQNYTQDKTVNFVGCVMGTDNPEKDGNAKKCARENKLQWRRIKTCVNGEEGDTLFLKFANITDQLNPKLEYVPHIIFNDVFNKTLEDESRDNFLKTACGLFQEKPSGCQE